jgi:DNA-binding IclR family transcriptional regulator
MADMTEEAPKPPAKRGLSTARAVLQVLAFLSEHPQGVHADEVAAVVGKSVSTAYYLLASLCEEGFAVHEGGLYRPAHPVAAAAAAAEDHPPGLARAVDTLFLRTHKRAYLGVLETRSIRIAVIRGRQGMPRMPGLGTHISDSAHALAMGKVVLALLRPAALDRYIAGGLRTFTANTITTRDALLSDLAEVRRTGVAFDREEFDDDFCCVAAPVLDAGGALLAVLALSASTRAFDAERDTLADAVREVAREASPSSG